ncbi:alpha-amylase family glycosyl hydrolase [Engelhardtia mirabilis]|uniref:1,4-alpha-glucan branching enzyme n=1 Tax=Engelhardtia mirabilis TaxID=2528011 RepID=A0A518BLN3_9BACT|nr:1,4-alpha-glucan branching enzyme GlgB [Planctomycetes bacterium Pla133]QDV02210.1 1,4-alpha-glucan branching enzyme GlgB [Planctomycetes bacterium Pla86]
MAPRRAILAALIALSSTPLVAHPQLSTAAPQLERTGFHYVAIFVGNYTPQLSISLADVGDPNADLYLRKNQKPTLKDWDLRSANPHTSDERIRLNADSPTPISTGVWWIGIHGPTNVQYDLSWSTKGVPSKQPGLGSIPYAPAHGQPGGVTFRVWAPFADSVNLAGDFTGWSGALAPMGNEGDGYFSLDVRNLTVGAQYKYVIKNGAQTLWKTDPRSKQVTNSIGNSVVVEPKTFAWTDTDYQTPAWNDLVIYELHVGTFNDTVGGPVGTFDSAIQRLDLLAELGVNAVELLPVNEFAGDSSWGYNLAFPWAVESAYGSIDGLLRFVDEAHQRGIAVLMDVLYNHWGPSDLDLWKFDGWSQGGWGGIYFYNSIQAQTPWGDTRPDFGRPEVRQYIRDNVMYWLEDCRVDGFRFDSVLNIRTGPLGDIPEGWSLLQWINDEINASQPWKINIAEDLQGNPWITKTTGEGGAGFDSQWDAGFVHPIRDALITPNDSDRNMWSVRDAIQNNYNGSAFQRVVYTESHDEVANGKARVPEEIWPGNASSWYSKKRSTLGGALVMTAPGVPMLFQGQELLEDGYFQDSDPVDWTKLATFGGIRQLYADLITLRRDGLDNTAGLKGPNTNVHHVDDNNKVVAFHRWDQGGPGDDVIVVANFANTTWSQGQNYRIGVPRAGTWYVRFNSDWSGYDASFGNHPTVDVNADSIPWDGMPYSISLSFAPYTCVILSQ